MDTNKRKKVENIMDELAFVLIEKEQEGINSSIYLTEDEAFEFKKKLAELRDIVLHEK